MAALVIPELHQVAVQVKQVVQVAVAAPRMGWLANKYRAAFVWQDKVIPAAKDGK